MTSPAERFLIDFHARYAGATSLALGGMPVRCGGEVFASSYELLAAQVPEHASSVLDVACGDGYLLGTIAKLRPGAALAGVDMSEHELRAAQRRLDGRAQLAQCMAQHLPFGDASFDAVTSHMALMLMDDSRSVLREIARVLQPRGTFAAVVGASMPDSPALELYRSVLRPHLQASTSAVAFGDKEWRTAEGIRTLLEAAGLHGIRIADVEGELALPPEQLWDWFMLMYDAHFVDAFTRDAMRAQFLAGAVASAGGNVGVSVAWRLFTATRA